MERYQSKYKNNKLNESLLDDIVFTFQKKSDLKEFQYFLNHYEQGLNQLKKLNNILIKLQKQFNIVDFRMPNGWAVAEVYFEFQKTPELNEVVANSIYDFLKKLKVPLVKSEWTNGDRNTIFIQLNKL